MPDEQDTGRRAIAIRLAPFNWSVVVISEAFTARMAEGASYCVRATRAGLTAAAPAWEVARSRVWRTARRQMEFDAVLRLATVGIFMACIPSHLGQQTALPHSLPLPRVESVTRSGSEMSAAPAPAPVHQVVEAPQVQVALVKGICSLHGQVIFMDEVREEKASAGWKDGISAARPDAVCAFTTRTAVPDPAFVPINLPLPGPPAAAPAFASPPAPPVEAPSPPTLVSSPGQPVASDQIAQALAVLGAPKELRRLAVPPLPKPRPVEPAAPSFMAHWPADVSTLRSWDFPGRKLSLQERLSSAFEAFEEQGRSAEPLSAAMPPPFSPPAAQGLAWKAKHPVNRNGGLASHTR